MLTTHHTTKRLQRLRDTMCKRDNFVAQLNLRSLASLASQISLEILNSLQEAKWQSIIEKKQALIAFLTIFKLAAQYCNSQSSSFKSQLTRKIRQRKVTRIATAIKALSFLCPMTRSRTCSWAKLMVATSTTRALSAKTFRIKYATAWRRRSQFFASASQTLVKMLQTNFRQFWATMSWTRTWSALAVN